MCYPSISLATVIIILLIVSPVNSQTPPILNVETIKDGGTFTITCDASRTPIPKEYSNINDIFGLKLFVNSTAYPTFSVAQYHPSLADPNKQFKNVTWTGRAWAVSFSGGKNGTDNRQTMKIEVLVTDAKCSDAGTYTCITSYTVFGDFKDATYAQSVDAEAATSEPVLTFETVNSGPDGWSNYSMYQVNDNITMSCRVDGPKNLAIKWRRERRPISAVVLFEDYPVQKDITDEPTTQTGSEACSLSHYESQLSFSVTENDKKRLYSCVIQTDGRDTITTSVTVDLITATPPPINLPSSGGTAKGDIGLIVGVVLGCLAVIIIIAVIICVVCYRRRSKKSNNKEDTDRPDGGATEATYPTVHSRTPYESNPDRGTKAHDVSERRDKQPNDAFNYKRNERKPRDPTQNSGNDDNHQQKPIGRYRNRGGGPGNTQYTSVDASHSEDETAAQPVAPPVKEKPKPAPKPKPQIAKRKEEDRPLDYAQLDLPPRRNEGPESTGRRKANLPVEYAEISV